MNPWVKKSIERVKQPGYLDAIFGIYPMAINSRRTLAPELIEIIRVAYDKRDAAAMIRILLDLEKFPVKDSYVAFLRHSPSAIDTNPETVERIGRILFAMPFEEMVDRATEPKETNTQIGPLFSKWLPQLGYEFLNEEEFEKASGPAFLSGSDRVLKEYANGRWGMSLEKGLDFIFKVGRDYVIGEAKFITAQGGHQYGQFVDALSVMNNPHGNITKIAVLDGIIWIEGNNKFYNRIKNEEAIAMSALYMEEFLKKVVS